MPDAPAATHGKLKPWQYGAALGGAVIVYVLYKRMQASSAATAATGLTGGTTIPDNSTTNAPISSTTLPATLSEWISAVVSGVSGPTYSPTQALNDVESWFSGQCVSSGGYNAIGSAIDTLGLPPGYNTGVPSLSVCPDVTQPAPTTTTTTTPPPATTPGLSTPTAPAIPGLSAALAAAMTQSGETLVGATYSAVDNTFYYLTDKGGVYSVGGPGSASPNGNFYGSYEGLHGQATNNPGTFKQIIALPTGGYTLLDSQGQEYTFGPGIDPTTGGNPAVQ